MTRSTRTPSPAAPVATGTHRTFADKLNRFRFLGSATDITAVLIVIVVAFSILKPNAFFTTTNFTNILNDASLLLVMGVGATFVLITGGVDLSVGSVLVFSGVIGGVVMRTFADDPVLASGLGIVAAIVAGAIWGVINGWMITKLRVPALIATLGSYGAAEAIAQIITNGNDGSDIPAGLANTLGYGRILGVPWLVVVALVTALIGGSVLFFTRYGRRTYSVGSNQEAARRAGINVDRHLISVYMIAGLLAGVAGIMSYAKFGTTTLSGHSTDNLNVIAAVVIGGTSLFGGVGTMLGTVVGTLIPATLANGLVIEGLNSFWRDLAVGIVLVAAVYIDQLRRRSRTSR